MLLEICTANFQSAVNAQQAGAQRIELCSELAMGGITPSYGFMKQVAEQIEIPVMVLIRPRSGDFLYSKDEFEIMLKDIKICKELGFHGVVSGVLNSDFTIDVERTKLLVEAAKPLEFTFHRAFDHAVNPLVAVEQLAAMGVSRILTSGQSEKAIDGLDNLKAYQKVAGKKLMILPSGGINAENCSAFAKAGFSEIHASATQVLKQTDHQKIPMNSPKFMAENSIAVSKETNIKNILSLLND
ncbi:copper homeostasis protein CutC [Nonlabens antarcticus]|uniref:copper homeostasis protein CutC n=1 Tax=Nonlabens antarcticus TaxID=392714 RepID=UPI001891719F|nr:copper homeostasis protein CutC [Nonlabens antarcticus]